MTHFRVRSMALVLALLTPCAPACNEPKHETACVRFPNATTPTATPATVATPTQPNLAPRVEGTWLFHCCDGASTWIGMLVLVEDHGTLHGAWLTDGDSHGSYVDGHSEGAQVQLSRRWRTGAVRHEQTYALTLDGEGRHLNGTFREPAFDPAPHAVQLERGFVNEPRVVESAATTPVLTPIGTEKHGPKLDPQRPCDCRLVCYCGGIPPGPEHYEEAARCGGSCKCSVCPPLP